MSPTSYALGLDYGTNSVRCLIIDAQSGQEAASAVALYEHGQQGIVSNPKIPDLARQHPEDYLKGAVASVKKALILAAENNAQFHPDQILGIGIDATGSTPMPIDKNGNSLVRQPQFADEPAAMAWLWKDHTASEEAQKLTAAASVDKPEYLEKCGGNYSSEWFWAKLWRCVQSNPEVVAAAYSWIEISDWIPAILTGKEQNPVRNICAAGHKALYNTDWGGYPDEAFLAAQHPELARIRRSLDGAIVQPIHETAGHLSPSWASKLGLKPGTPIATGALDAHMGAVGCGIKQGTMVKIMGTSTCDIIVAPQIQELPFIPGLCGIVSESVLPDHHGLEAGQSAVGDLFGWWVDTILGDSAHTHASLTDEAILLKPGETGLLALDWNNGNRCLLCDPQLTGLILGQTIQTRPSEIYRALIEATAFGARMILEQMARHGIPVNKVIACGGLAEQNPMLMQIYADITHCEILISGSNQTCALGGAIAGSVVGGIYPDIMTAQSHLTYTKSISYKPDQASRIVYDCLFNLYRQLHDSFGAQSNPNPSMHGVMKELLLIRQKERI